jgi:hypothetical protein
VTLFKPGGIGPALMRCSFEFKLLWGMLRALPAQRHCHTARWHHTHLSSAALAVACPLALRGQCAAGHDGHADSHPSGCEAASCTGNLELQWNLGASWPTLLPLLVSTAPTRARTQPASAAGVQMDSPNGSLRLPTAMTRPMSEESRGTAPTSVLRPARGTQAGLGTAAAGGG